MRHFVITSAIVVLVVGIIQDARAADRAADISAAPASNLQDLLERVEAGRLRDAAAAAAREAEFAQNRARQQAELNKVKADIARAEAQSLRLEKKFSENEARLAELQGVLDDRLGVLGELFGLVRLTAGQTAGQIEASLISGEWRDRTDSLVALADSKDLPAIAQLENLWIVLHQEMTAQGEVKHFQGQLVAPDGTLHIMPIMRIGAFTAIAQEGLVRYQGQGRFAIPPRQPSGRLTDIAEDLFVADTPMPPATGAVYGVIDPSRGALLDVLLQLPNLRERLSQGGVIGGIIIVLGMIGLVLVGERLVRLTSMARLMDAQLAGEAIDHTSPLQRVLQVARTRTSNDNAPPNDATYADILERKLDDAILKELPALEKNLNVVKVLAAIAPLLGLLGTVTGMILTFEAIARFGTGDPKLMADGISQALMTTVLGLCVAIPLLALHAIASTRARALAHILEEQAAGLIAEHYIKQDKLRGGVA